MKIKIQEIPADGLFITLADHLVSLDRENIAVEGSINGKLFIKKQSTQSVYIRGTVSTHLLLSCRRCLNPFGYPMTSEFSLDYAHAAKTQSGQERQLYKEEMDIHFYRGDTLDINEIIESQLYLEAPMAPLCKFDCKGLCVACGDDLNKGVHLCKKGKE